MRINEFANAEEQLALWKLISDNVWTAVRTQAEQQARANAEKAQQAKAKKPTSKRSKSVKAPYAPPPPPLPKPKYPKQIPQTSSQIQQQSNVGTPNPHTKSEVPKHQPSGGDTHPQANLTNPHLANTQPTQQMGGGMPQQQPNVANPTQLQQPPHKPLTQQQMRLQRRNSTLLRRNTSI
jgi:hypothetical protein